jgi:hypothetical protein
MTRKALTTPTPSEALSDFRTRQGDLWAYCTDLDLQTVLALTRALTRTMLDLSPLAESRMTLALKREIGILEGSDDAASATVATALRQYLLAD